jgi:hypothetical protein
VVLPESADPNANRVDTAGALLGSAVLAAMVFAIIDAETAGFAAPEVIALFCVSALAAVAFVWREARAAHPLVDLKYLRVARFTTANIVAFCTYFATFAIFFFTALYLFEVVGLSGFRIALVFLPMTVLMIVASLLAGRWLNAIGGAGPVGREPQPASALSPAAGGAGPHRHRHRCHGRAHHVLGTVGGAAGTIGHGRLGHQHQP